MAGDSISGELKAGKAAKHCCCGTCPNSSIGIECSFGCGCDNRKFQVMGRTGPSVDLLKCDNGETVVSRKPVNIGELIAEVCGELIVEAEKEKREKDLDMDQLANYHGRLFSLGTGIYLDTTRMCSTAALVRTAKCPECPECPGDKANACLEFWIVKRRPRLGLFAIKRISISEEILIEPPNFDIECECGAKCFAKNILLPAKLAMKSRK